MLDASFPMYYTGVRDIMAKINLGILVFFPTIYLATFIGAEKSVIKNLIAEKERWTNKWNDKQSTIQLVIPNICTKFQKPRCHSSCEIFDQKKNYTQIYKQKRQKLYTPHTCTSYAGVVIRHLGKFERGKSPLSQ